MFLAFFSQEHLLHRLIWSIYTRRHCSILTLPTLCLREGPYAQWAVGVYPQSIIAIVGIQEGSIRTLPVFDQFQKLAWGEHCSCDPSPMGMQTQTRKITHTWIVGNNNSYRLWLDARMLVLRLHIIWTLLRPYYSMDNKLVYSMFFGTYIVFFGT